MALFDWRLCEDEDEAIDEICEGLRHFNRNTLLTIVSSIVYEVGFDLKEIAVRIDEIDGSIFSIPVGDGNEDKDT